MRSQTNYFEDYERGKEPKCIVLIKQVDLLSPHAVKNELGFYSKV